MNSKNSLVLKLGLNKMKAKVHRFIARNGIEYEKLRAPEFLIAEKRSLFRLS